ncbi:hypothetical protein [Bifidobacterium psychraerophilum]|jgi:hypothetical protein|uniref:hypothetical protein n=1 Tax=Bifidobacterium psychraerophilum TaxID=218140 RepID=UPI0023F57603|nr:hypothetical protein [Bifidobacterium psychraerophilum]MCI1659551.1 hypothetical protein [Bifidobacterium psychraerophilum]MCI1804481.1 hypothetical protein [Bifidobacterium psychraerophilum]MCI2176362.1 hypothetical protein [Bifidobacterium psychraerophilum]MCI2181164.1 hypothetical protein [Bifidobacterium psychraerophilum]
MFHLHTKNDTEEWTAKQLAHVLAQLGEHYPISDTYEREYLPGPHWWSSQREHVVRWLREYTGPGAFNRKTRGLDAKSFWNHFLCAPGLLWTAEALGEDLETVQAAADAASVKMNVSSQCAAIRAIIPWKRIAELATKQQ